MGKKSLERYQKKLICRRSKQYKFRFSNGEKYYNLKFFFSTKYPIAGTDHPEMMLYFCNRATIHKSWVEVIIKASHVLNSKSDKVLGVKYQNEDVSVMESIKEILSRRSRRFMLLITRKSNKQKKKYLTVEIDSGPTWLTPTRPIYVQGKPRLLNPSDVGVKFKASLKFINYVQSHIISLPVQIKNIFMQVNVQENVPHNIIWIHDNYEKYKEYGNDRYAFCDKDIIAFTGYTYCLNFSRIPKVSEKRGHYYIFFWSIYRWKLTNIVTQRKSRKILKSWYSAFKLCRQLGGSLPLIRSSDELLEIISLLKITEDMPPIEALFIGLIRHYKKKVCKK